MKISFCWRGIDFDAEVNYIPEVSARISGPPEDCYPGESAELEYLSLTHDGQDVSWLGEAIEEDIFDVAHEACIQEYKGDKDEAAEEEWERRKDDLTK